MKRFLPLFIILISAISYGFFHGQILDKTYAIRISFLKNPDDSPDAESAEHCTGALITPKHILTAAHCIQESGVKRGDTIYVIYSTPTEGVEKIGQTLRYQGGRTKVAGLHYHPSYAEALFDGKIKNLGGRRRSVGPWSDVAVIETEKGSPVIPVLPIAKNPASPRELIWIGGYGPTEADLEGFDMVPSYSEKRVALSANSRDDATRFVILPENDQNPGKTTSPAQSWAVAGDSGGPALRQLADGGREIVGVNSFQTYPVDSSKTEDPTLFTPTFLVVHRVDAQAGEASYPKVGEWLEKFVSEYLGKISALPEKN